VTIYLLYAGKEEEEEERKAPDTPRSSARLESKRPTTPTSGAGSPGGQGRRPGSPGSRAGSPGGAGKRAGSPGGLGRQAGSPGSGPGRRVGPSGGPSRRGDSPGGPGRRVGSPGRRPGTPSRRIKTGGGAEGNEDPYDFKVKQSLLYFRISVLCIRNHFVKLIWFQILGGIEFFGHKTRIRMEPGLLNCYKVSLFVSQGADLYHPTFSHDACVAIIFITSRL
jgi:hypothetical protein